ncbi:hypothetical protein SO694_00004051 [Aureococcus anophagefferens]|uniref:U-box domain-containing protein n=1 Tax=Aureococcus anophagefferens TaxID=44056 RepID=A0ABR1G8U1_AURAN
MASCTLHTLLGACGLPQHYAKLHAEEVDVDLLRDDILTLDDLAGLIPRADAEKVLATARGAAEDDEPPDSFVCPISYEVMRDPVTAADGTTYDRAFIAAWLSKHDTSPATNLPGAREAGSVVSFNASFGFIKPVDGGRCVFFHRDDLRDDSTRSGLEPDDFVSFRWGVDVAGRPKAVDVALL